MAGRLICEAMFDSPKNQDYFCEVMNFDSTYGRVTINRSLPIIIKQKLAEEPDFLFSLHSMDKFKMDDVKTTKGTSSLLETGDRCYWSFPQFKEISSAVLS